VHRIILTITNQLKLFSIHSNIVVQAFAEMDGAETVSISKVS